MMITRKLIYGSVSLLCAVPNAYADDPLVLQTSSSMTAESESSSGGAHTYPSVDAATAAMLGLPPTGYDDEKLNEILDEVKLLQLEKTRLELQHEVKLLSLQQERDRLLLENELAVEKNRKKLTELTAQKEKITLENELHAAQEQQQLANLSAAKARLELENTLEEQRRLQKLAKTELEKASLELQNTIQAERNKQESMQIELETSRLNFELAKLDFDRAKNTVDLDILSNKLSERAMQKEWEDQVDLEVKYLKEPFVDGHLIISDRRIFLEGGIWGSDEGMTSVADSIIEQIHYYNNKSEEYPIFLVIGSSPGGSVMEGLKILKAMEKSRAPVYVVVQAFAASMAAVLTTLAKRSFAYPNAIILHHQVWGFSFGNVVEQKEQVEFLEEWNRRLIQPVAEKMGITLDEFVKTMYENNSWGDWLEFADEAAKTKWVDYVVEDVRDVSYINKPTEEDNVIEVDFVTDQKRQLVEKIDAQGKRYVQIPHLTLPDVYHLYNPDNYYRY